jgi:spore coat polysaccharide biosynthesis predicted glycosyltransferase SpsG
MGEARADRPAVVLRADGGREAGLGHQRRCRALAAALAPWAEVRIVVEAEPGLASALAAARDLGAAALVVDSYHVAPEALARARGAVRVTVRVDDTGRFPIPADLVVSPATGLSPPAAPGATRYLLGPRFALLEPAFGADPARASRGDVRRVLVVLGGATQAALMAAVARAVRAALATAAVDVVVGPVGDAADAVARALAGVGGVTVHAAPESLRPLMLAADLAVSGGGVTALELAATATPTVAVRLSENQRRNLDGLERAGAVVPAGDAADPGLAAAVEAAVAALARDPARRRRLGEQGRDLVDGRGVTRVADELRALVTAPAAIAAGARPC